MSKYLKDNLPQYFLNKFNKDIYSKAETTSKYFMKVYDNIQNKLITDHPRVSQYCGSTACICVHFLDSNKKNKLWVFNVGDSRAVKCNYTNIAEPLSIDHKPNAPYERNRIEQLGGEIRFDGSDWRIKELSLSRAFGDLECKPYVSHLPQIYNHTINIKDKFIILACDGLWDILSNQDAVDFINDLLLNPKFNGNYAKELAEYGFNKGSMDNITVLVYMLDI